ncbi:MAG: hypothetical protein JSW06_00385 [Thermoplasmatales archaeon]|nr:MAG: hypothetical protein JSW06_00385 [Thermoplasmatales archaeon]
MKRKYRANNKSVNKLLRLITIILLVSSSIFTLFNIFFINISIASKNSNEWQVTLIINEPGGTSDTVIFGEKITASDGKDQFDIPKPPTPQVPYLHSWFTTSFDPPHNALWEEYRAFSDKEKVWNLNVLWESNGSLQTSIIISWDISELEVSGLDSAKLYIQDTANMMVDSNYQFTANTNKLYNFQIIYQNEQSEEKSDTNNSTFIILLVFIIIILIIVLAIYLKKIKK